MKWILSVLLFSLGGGFHTTLNAAVFDQAKITRVHNDVRILDAQQNSQTASAGDQIHRISSVITGNDSRAELQFPDASISRLGANSRFTLREQSRSLDLESGVIMLQVPKRMGGAKVRTAAVTAAITGTTVIFEYRPGGHIKVIVIEGEVDLFLTDKPSIFRTLKAGEMIIMPPNGTNIPLPVDVDLKRLLKTSKLLHADDKDTPNRQEVQAATQAQAKQMAKGELVGTNLMIDGRGTEVTITQQSRNQVVSNGTPRPSSSRRQRTTSHRTPHINDTATRNHLLITEAPPLNENSLIHTNPRVDIFHYDNNEYTTYRGQLIQMNQSTPARLYGASRHANSSIFSDWFNPNLSWATFKFDQLEITDFPQVEVINEVRRIALTAYDTITLGSLNAPYYESYLQIPSELFHTLIYSHTGHIQQSLSSQIESATSSLNLIANGTESDIQLGSIRLEADPYQVTIDPISPDIERNLRAYANRDIEVGETASYENHQIRAQNIQLKARRHIKINDSATLRAIAHLGLEALEGNIDIQGKSGYTQLNADTIDIKALRGNVAIQNSQITGRIINAQTFGANGTLHIGNSQFTSTDQINLIAHGFNGAVEFSGNTNITASNVKIAGKTITVLEHGNVNIHNANAVKIFTDTDNFNKAGFGNISSSNNNLDIKGFNNR